MLNAGPLLVTTLNTVSLLNPYMTARIAQVPLDSCYREPAGLGLWPMPPDECGALGPRWSGAAPLNLGCSSYRAGCLSVGKGAAGGS